MAATYTIFATDHTPIASIISSEISRTHALMAFFKAGGKMKKAGVWVADGNPNDLIVAQAEFFTADDARDIFRHRMGR